MAIYTSDQQTTNYAVAKGGLIEVANATVLDAISEAPTYVFSAVWTQVYNGAILSFRPGVPYPIDATLLAALNAASAPITSA